MKENLQEVLKKIQSFLQTDLKGRGSPQLVKQYTGADTRIAALAYVPFVCVAILILRKENSEFVSFHAKHALILLLAAIFFILLSPKFIKMFAIVAVYVMFVFGAYKASKGEKWYFPAVTELANTIEV